MKVLFLAAGMAAMAMTGFAQEKKAYLGVNIATAHVHGNTGHKASDPGVIITGVADESAAAKAGLQKQDIILTVNGTDVSSANELIDSLTVFDPGDEITLHVVRDGEAQDIVVALGEKPKILEHHNHMKKWVFRIDEDSAWVGINMMNLKPQLANYFGVEEGVLIEKVQEDGPAANAGLQAGDVILAWEDTEIHSQMEFMKAIAAAKKDDVVTLKISRKGKVMNVPMTLGARKDNPNKRENFSFLWNSDETPELEFHPRSHRSFKFLHNKDLLDVDSLHEQMQELRKELEALKSKQD